MPCVSLEIRESKEYPGAYSIKINGREVSQDICYLQLTIEAGQLPTLTVKAITEGMNLSSTALLEVPEPYKPFYEDYEKFYKACRDEFKAHEKAP